MKRRKTIKGKRLCAPTAVRSKEGLRKIFRVCTKLDTENLITQYYALSTQHGVFRNRK